MSELAFEMGRKYGQKEVINAFPDEIEIYRAIKKSGARKHGDIAKVIAAMFVFNPL